FPTRRSSDLFRFLRREFGKNSAKAEGILAERRAHPVFPSGGRVTFVEDQVDDFEDGRQTSREILAARHFEGNARFAESALGANDALRDGWLGHQKSARDFLGGEAAKQPKRKSDARLGRKNRVTGNEHKTERSEEHTSELQSLAYLVCRLL